MVCSEFSFVRTFYKDFGDSDVIAEGDEARAV
jgi:hypothetical protein